MALERRAAPLREQAVEVLRALIVGGELAPGARITEKSLEQRLGVSRTVVREALRQLESERLVRIQPGSGPVVAKLTPDEARQPVRGARRARGHGCQARGPTRRRGAHPRAAGGVRPHRR